MIERMLDRARHDLAGLFEILDDDVRWELGPLNIPDVGATYIGPAGVEEFFRRWVGPFDEWDYEIFDVIEAGDSVLVHVRQWGRGKGSGATVESRFWQVWTIRDGKVVRTTHHSEKAEALQAVAPAG